MSCLSSERPPCLLCFPSCAFQFILSATASRSINTSTPTGVMITNARGHKQIFFCVQAEQRFADIEYITRCHVTSESELRGLSRWIHSRCRLFDQLWVVFWPDSASACGVRIPTARLLVSHSGGWSQKDLTPQTKKSGCPNTRSDPGAHSSSGPWLHRELGSTRL